MVFGKPVNLPEANPNAIIMKGDGDRTCIQNSDTEAIIMVQCHTNHVVDVADESGQVIETTQPGVTGGGTVHHELADRQVQLAVLTLFFTQKIIKKRSVHSLSCDDSREPLFRSLSCPPRSSSSLFEKPWCTIHRLSKKW